MSLAPAAYLLFQKVMRHDRRTRCGPAGSVCAVCGHSSLTLYIQLYLAGYGLAAGRSQAAPAMGLAHPGSPEHGHTAGVETTTGPLGQGFGNAVGFAMAARRERGLFDEDAAPGESLFDHQIYVLASDGDMEEGISHEVAALAAHQKLGNLLLIWDDNQISIEDDTNIPSPRTCRHASRLRLHVQQSTSTPRTVTGGSGGALPGDPRGQRGDRQAVLHRSEDDHRWPAPHKQNTGKAHGSALGADEVAATRRSWAGTRTTFEVPEAVLAHTREALTVARPRIRPGRSVRRLGAKNPTVWPCSTAGQAGAAGRLDRRAAGVQGRPERHRDP